MAQHYSGAYQLPDHIIQQRNVGSMTHYVVPVKLHVVRTSAGTGGIPQAQIDISFMEANAAFAAINVEFCVPDPIDYIDDDVFYDQITNIPRALQLLRTNSVDGAINVYYVEDFFLCGLSSLTPTPEQGIIMKNSCTGTPANTGTFVHELGHYFDLYHTHDLAFGPECVDGSNCATAGDLVCDTPADPNLNFSVDNNCVFTGSQTDACNGAPFSPLTDNFMSYTRVQCRASFTQGQLDRMLATLINLRPELARPVCAGSVYATCSPAAPNASGTPATLTHTGQQVVSANDVSLNTSGLPANTFGIYVNGQTLGAPFTPMGSQGNLCLASDIGRYILPGQVLSSGDFGFIGLPLDLTETPTPFGLTQVVSGQTWAFQLWFRDFNAMGGASSNFSNAVVIPFY